MRRKCGGFAAKECGDDERYYAEGLRPPKKGQRSKQPPQPQAEPQPAAGGGTDMRAVFAKLTKQGCAACIGAGYGWCPIKRRCGGFANKECGVGPNYVADSYKPTKKSSPSPPPSMPVPSGTTDMRAVFAKLRDCSSCVGAGYGWCPMQRKCGGFANRECGLGPNYVAAGPEPKAARNGLWESKGDTKKVKEVNAPPTAEVPKASPPPPATLLHAGPAPPRNADTMAVEVGAKEASTTTVSAAAQLSNASEAELMELPREDLVSKILALQSEIVAMKAA